MKIFRAIGLVIGLIALRLLMSEVFHAVESALVSFFGALQRFAEFANPSSFTAAGFESVAPQIPHY
jgi:hypothetical protein